MSTPNDIDWTDPDVSVWVRTKYLAVLGLPIFILLAGILVFFIIPLAVFMSWMEGSICK